MTFFDSNVVEFAFNFRKRWIDDSLNLLLNSKKKFEIIIKNIFQVFIVIRTNESLKLKIFFQESHTSKNFRSIVSKTIKTRQKFYLNILKSTNMFVFILLMIRRLIFKFLLLRIKNKHNRYRLRSRNDNEIELSFTRALDCDAFATILNCEIFWRFRIWVRNWMISWLKFWKAIVIFSSWRCTIALSMIETFCCSCSLSFETTLFEISETSSRFFILDFEMSTLNSIMLLINFESFFSKDETIKIVRT